MSVRAVFAVLVVAAAASSALAHGGNFASPPPGGGGPQAAPGCGDPPNDAGRGVETKWETWWVANREDLLQVAQRADAALSPVVTPSSGAAARDPAKLRAERAAKVREDVVPPLLLALDDDDFDVRCSAAIALGKTGDARASKPLESVSLRDRRPDVRRSALLAIGLLGRPEALPYLSDSMSNHDRWPDERAMAALAAGLIGGARGAAVLTSFVERSPTKAGAQRTESDQLLGTVYCALGLTDSIDAILPLWRAADDDSCEPFLRGQALLSLGRLGDRESLDRLSKFLAPTADVQLRRCAAAALGRLVRADDDAALRALSAAAESDADAGVRRHAIVALGRSRAASARPLLRRLFEAGDQERPLIAVAMGLSGDAMAAPSIREGLKSARDDAVRSAYCTALGLLADEDSIPALEQQLGPGPSPGLYRGFAAMALAAIPSQASREAIWRRVTPATDPRIRFDCCVALGLLGDARVRAYLLDELKNGETVFVRCGAAASLGALRRDDVVTELIPCLFNPRMDGVVRAFCAVALGQIADPSVVPKLSRLSSGCDTTFATKALAEALTIL